MLGIVMRPTLMQQVEWLETLPIKHFFIFDGSVTIIYLQCFLKLATNLHFLDASYLIITILPVSVKSPAFMV